MTSRHELDDLVYAQVKRKCADADDLAENGDTTGALDLYREALALLPSPETNWEATTWIYAAIGDTCFASGAFEDAQAALERALESPGGRENPFIYLRLGQCLFELGELPRAEDTLARAHMLGGEEIFEDEDPKYANHLRTVMHGTRL